MGWKKSETPVAAILDSGSSPSAKTKQTPRSGHKPGGKNSATTKCGRCGKSPFHDRQQCPARDTVCHNCAKRGHFKFVCRSVKVSEIRVDNPKEEDAILGGIQKEGNQSDGSPWAVTLFLNGKPINFEIDTGAEVNVISPSGHSKIGSPSTTTSETNITWSEQSRAASEGG